MNWSDLPLNPSRRTLRQFGGLCVVFFGFLAARSWMAHPDGRTALVLGALAAAGGVLGLIAPSLLRPVFVGALVLAFPIGWVVSRVILVLMFGLVIIPLGFVFRLQGRDVLGLKRRGDDATYWVAKPAPSDLKSYFRQF
jgi:hypothetical protein